MDDLKTIYHKIRAKLYPNYLSNVNGAYIARTTNEKTLSVNDICSILKTRAGFTGKYEDMVEHVKQYYNEVAYQICDGYAVSNDYYTIYPNIGGSFKTIRESRDPVKHPVSFRFSAKAKLRKVAEKVEVIIDGIADSSGYIDMFTDFEGDSVNAYFIPGNQFAIRGHKIKLAGDDPGIGVYFVPLDNPSKAVKVERIAENNPSKITGIIPNTEYQYYTIEIRTQYTGSGSILLKAPRSIKSSFVLEAA